MAVYEQIEAGGGDVVIRAVDLFCGAGGTSSGLVRACKELGVKLQLVAVNHNPIAIDTHSKNHKHAIHYCTGLDSLEPKTVRREAFNLVSDETALDLLIASPECTHHSNARGGKPVNDQSRASGLHVARWIEIFRPWEVLLENVPEWQSWGPTKRMTKVIKGKKVTGDWPAACAAIGTAGRQWSYPGHTVDRTPYGVIAHELGHHVDGAHGSAPSREGYGARWRVETREKPLTGYCRDDNEWFAEMFRLFITNPNLLRLERPKTHALMMDQWSPAETRAWDVVLASAPRQLELLRRRFHLTAQEARA